MTKLLRGILHQYVHALTFFLQGTLYMLSCLQIDDAIDLGIDLGTLTNSVIARYRVRCKRVVVPILDGL